MRSGAKHTLLLSALLMGMLLIGACENDIKDIKELSAKESEKPLQQTTGVDVIYSDMAKVKLRLLTPLLIEYNDTAKNAREYRTTPKGVKVIFYDTVRVREAGNIVADSSIQYQREGIIEFHRNVVATSVDGKVFKSEELIWDQEKKIIYSNLPVQGIMKDGSIINGVGFTSDDQLKNPLFRQAAGEFYTDETP